MRRAAGRAGIVIGECVALCLIILYLIKRAGGGFRSKAAAAGLYGLLVLRKGGSLSFIRGIISGEDGRPVMNFSGTIKKRKQS